MKAFTTGPFTGRHAAAGLVLFFGVVIAVNLVMAHYATSTFGGEVVENSYVASQKFNTWLDEARKEKAMGWSAAATHRADGKVAVTLVGAPVAGVTLIAEARHPLGRLPDQQLRFERAADGTFVSLTVLPTERWKLRLEADAGKDHWRAEQDMR